MATSTHSHQALTDKGDDVAIRPIQISQKAAVAEARPRGHQQEHAKERARKEGQI